MFELNKEQRLQYVVEVLRRTGIHLPEDDVGFAFVTLNLLVLENHTKELDKLLTAFRINARTELSQTLIDLREYRRFLEQVHQASLSLKTQTEKIEIAHKKALELHTVELLKQIEAAAIESGRKVVKESTLTSLARIETASNAIFESVELVERYWMWFLAGTLLSGFVGGLVVHFFK